MFPALENTIKTMLWSNPHKVGRCIMKDILVVDLLGSSFPDFSSGSHVNQRGEHNPESFQ